MSAAASLAVRLAAVALPLLAMPLLAAAPAMAQSNLGQSSGGQPQYLVPPSSPIGQTPLPGSAKPDPNAAPLGAPAPLMPTLPGGGAPAPAGGSDGLAPGAPPPAGSLPPSGPAPVPNGASPVPRGQPGLAQPSAPQPGVPQPAAPQPSTAPAQPQQPADIPPAMPYPNLWVPRPLGDVQLLDKVNATVKSVTLKLGDSVSFGSLVVTLRTCVSRPTDQPQDSAAFLDIADNRKGQPGFKGWMFASEPEVSMMEDPIYDVRLNSCHG